MKQVIVLEKLPEANRYRYALWAAVPAARQAFYASPDATSAFKNASQAELDALKAGSVVERTDVISVAAGTSLATIQAELQATWQRFQDEITSSNPWVRYGTSWDGNNWTPAGVN